jgi:PPOX class probable F420-dependent enzyme
MTVLAPDVDEFLKGAHVAALSTVRPDGRPHVTPVWYEFNGREFVVSTLRNSQKMRNVANKGFAAICIYTQELPYRLVIVEGTARTGGPIDNVWRERVAARYLGDAAARAYAMDTAELDAIAIHLRPVKWHTEGFETS